MRHELEWKVWEHTRLRDSKLLIPGVVSHATNLIEPPELVAERIIRFAKVVGREKVVAGTDCGLGGPVHHEIAWAKLAASCLRAPDCQHRTLAVTQGVSRMKCGQKSRPAKPSADQPARRICRLRGRRY